MTISDESAPPVMLSTNVMLNSDSFNLSKRTLEAGEFSKLKIYSDNLFTIFFLKTSNSSEVTEFISILSFIIPLLAKYAMSKPFGLNSSICSANADSA